MQMCSSSAIWKKEEITITATTYHGGNNLAVGNNLRTTEIPAEHSARRELMVLGSCWKRRRRAADMIVNYGDIIIICGLRHHSRSQT